MTFDGGLPKEPDDEDELQAKLDEMEENVEMMMGAVSLLDSLIETAEQMDGDAVSQQVAEMKQARETCENISKSMAITLASYGQFDEGLDADEDDTYQ